MGRNRRQNPGAAGIFSYTREQFAERLGVTPKFCSDIELGVKGMSVPTLCKIAQILRLSTDFILFGALETDTSTPLSLLLKAAPARSSGMPNSF